MSKDILQEIKKYEVYKMVKTLKEKLIEFKDIEATRSDIQGIALSFAYELNKNNIPEIENILLLFYDDELNINEAKRYLLDLINIKKVD